MDHTKRQPPEAARGRATPPARRNQARATQQATTQKEEAQARSTERQNASTQRPRPKHKAHTNTHHHTQQPTTRHRSTAHPPHHSTAEKKKEEERREEKGKKNKQGKKRHTRRGEEEKRKENQERGGGQRAPRPKAPRAGKHGKPETGEAHHGARKNSNNHKQGNRSPEGAEQTRRAPRRATGQGEAQQNAPGRPARPTWPEEHTHTHAHGARQWRPPTRKGRCWRPHKTPPSKDGRYGKPDASVTGSTHAHYRSARSRRRTPEGCARNKPIAGPRMGTTRARRGAPTRGHEARRRGTSLAPIKAEGQVPSNNGLRVPPTRAACTTLNEPRHRNRCQAPPNSHSARSNREWRGTS